MKLTINNKEFEIKDSDNDTPLLWLLRDSLGLKGSKYGCGIGACGSCTVLMGNKAVPACLITARRAENKHITTIEGLSEDNSHPLQRAWIELQVPQCGYCQSGQILTALSLLTKNPDPDENEIKSALSSVLCRCGTYPRVIQAVKLAAKYLREDLQ